MAIRTRSVLAIGLALLAAACGTATSGPGAHAKATPSQTAALAMTATPDTDLTGGQPLPVRMTGFPPDSTTELYECVAAGACGAAAAATVLAYSSLLSTSWVSATQGWALAAQPCANGTCARLARTTDGGQHWQLLPDPTAGIQDGTTDCSAQVCVSRVSFASPAIGYLYGSALLITTDGGLTWHAQPGPRTETLTIAGGRVYRVTYTSGGCPGPCQPSLLEAPPGSANWRTLIGHLAEPGRSDSAQIVVSGAHVLVAMFGSLAGPIPARAVVYRSAAGGIWRQVADPCGGLDSQGSKQEDLIGLAAAPSGFFAGLCAPHNIASTFVITSADAGATWRPTIAPPHGHWLGFVAAASPATIAVATGEMSGNGIYTAQLLVTTDGGQHWVTTATDSQDLSTGSAPAWLGFETRLGGQWLGDAHGVWTTTDGGFALDQDRVPLSLGGPSPAGVVPCLAGSTSARQ